MRQRSPMRCLSWRSSGRSSLARSSGWPTRRICRIFSLVVSKLESSRICSRVCGSRSWASSRMRTVFWPARWRSIRKFWSAKSRWAGDASPGLAMPRSSSMYSRRPVEAEHRVGDERHRGRLVQPLEQRLEQGGLAGSDLAGQQDEALPLLDPVEELRERLLVRGRQVEKAGVRRRIERRLPEPEEGEVHGHGVIARPGRACGRAARCRGRRSRTRRRPGRAPAAPRAAGQPEAQSPPPQVGLGDDPRNAHEDRHRREGAQLRRRVERGVEHLGQHRDARGEAQPRTPGPSASKRRRFGAAVTVEGNAGSRIRNCSPFWRCSMLSATWASS